MNPVLLYGRQILYYLSHQGGPKDTYLWGMWAVPKTVFKQGSLF